MAGDAGNTDVAVSVIQQMGGQVDLLFTLAVAVFGGLVALIVQVILHNAEAESGKRLNLNRASRILIGISMVVICGSIICGYLARGSITATTPAIFRVDPSGLLSWRDAEFEGSGVLHFLVTAQVVLFIAAIGLVIALVFCNLRKLGVPSP